MTISRIFQMKPLDCLFERSSCRSFSTRRSLRIFCNTVLKLESCSYSRKSATILNNKNRRYRKEAETSRNCGQNSLERHLYCCCFVSICTAYEDGPSWVAPFTATSSFRHSGCPFRTRLFAHRTFVRRRLNGTRVSVYCTVSICFRTSRHAEPAKGVFQLF